MQYKPIKAKKAVWNTSFFFFSGSAYALKRVEISNPEKRLKVLFYTKEKISKSENNVSSKFFFPRT